MQAVRGSEPSQLVDRKRHNLHTGGHAHSKIAPEGAQSTTTPGRKESCWSIRLGGCGPSSTGAPSIISSASFRNSCRRAQSL